MRACPKDSLGENVRGEKARKKTQSPASPLLSCHGRYAPKLRADAKGSGRPRAAVAIAEEHGVSVGARSKEGAKEKLNLLIE